MEHIHGKFVRAYLKGEEDIISGILIGVEHSHVYIQSAPGEDGLFVIPQENIKYYQTSKVSFAEEEPPVVQAKEPGPQALSVYVDKELITSIPVPPTFDLSVCNDDILRVAWGNPEVKAALTGRVQKNIEYYSGVIIFNTDLGAPVSPQPIVQGNNTFAMGGAGSPTTSFLNPSDMVVRLSNLKNRGNNNEQQ